MNSEVRKLVRPALFWCSALAVVSSVAFISIYLAAADWHYREAATGLERYAEMSMSEFCASIELPVGPECERIHNLEGTELRRYSAENRERWRRSSALQDPIGSLGAASGLIASLAGFVFVGAVAALHVGGEWTTRTVAPTLIRNPSRTRFVLGKFASVWFAGVALIVTTWAVIALLGPVFRAFYEAFPAPSGFDMSTYALGTFAKALIVLAAFAAVGTLTGVAARHPLGALGLTGVLVAGSMIVPAIAASDVLWSLPLLVSGWMGFESIDVLGAHVWLSSDATNAWLSSGATLIAVVAACLSLAMLRMRAGDIRTE